jgi:hypothetical protein
MLLASGRGPPAVATVAAAPPGLAEVAALAVRPEVERGDQRGGLVGHGAPPTKGASAAAIDGARPASRAAPARS